VGRAITTIALLAVFVLLGFEARRDEWSGCATAVLSRIAQVIPLYPLGFDARVLAGVVPLLTAYAIFCTRISRSTTAR
jgi:hypothetical protein